MFTVAVDFPASVTEAFALLSDPARRPEWQSSLRRVDLVDERAAHLGTRWYDVTVAGVRPLLEITAWETDRLWQERGSWRGIEVDLSLRFEDLGPRSRVVAEATTHAPGLRRPAGWLLDRLGPRVARGDLERAARLLGHRE